MSYLIHLQQFEGPLGLLLYLIRKEEMNIMDINIGEITHQYLEYIRMMKELDLEVAGEFVAMAATLLQIKSRMLLPQYDEQGEVVEAEDPRKELVQKLLDYQKYQEAARQLYDRPLLNRDVFLRGGNGGEASGELADSESMVAIVVEEDGLFSLIAAFRRAVRKAERAVHKVRPKVQSIAARVLEIKDRLIVGTRVLLSQLVLIGGAEKESNGLFRTQLLVTFLSMLELGRMGFVTLFQSEIYGDIHIETIRPIERNVLERVQEFEGIGAEIAARSLITAAEQNRLDSEEQDMMHAADESVASTVSSVATGATGTEQVTMNFNGADSLESVEAFGFDELAPDAASDMASDDDILAAERELAMFDAPIELHSNEQNHSNDLNQTLNETLNETPTETLNETTDV